MHYRSEDVAHRHNASFWRDGIGTYAEYHPNLAIESDQVILKMQIWGATENGPD